MSQWNEKPDKKREDDLMNGNQALSVFTFGGKDVRVVMKDGEPWWVAKDVCDVLEISNPSQAISRLDDDERNTLILNEGNRGNPNVAVVNEQGINRLIYTCRKPEAKEFQRYNTHEILPAIYKTDDLVMSVKRSHPAGLSAFKRFYHELFGEVGTLELEGKPYFVGVDIARSLGYAIPSKAIIDHCKGISKLEVPSRGGVQETNVIPEGDVYRLVIKAAEQSKNSDMKEKAEIFEQWIFDGVLPTIRKTGGYVANDDLFIATYLPHADEQTKLMLKATLETVRKANETIAIMQPKAEYFDALVDRNLLTNFRDTAKELRVKEREFIHWTMSQGYVYRDAKGKLKPYARHVPNLFELKEWARNGKADTQTLITPKGRETFRLLLQVV